MNRKNSLFILFAFPLLLHAQTPCYTRIRQDGLNLMAKGNYGEAINQFWAAWVSCEDKPANNDLEKLIKQAQKKWVNDLEGRVETEKQAKEQINQSREQLLVANNALEKERLRAEANADSARVQGKKAESLRLILLSNNARQQGRKSDALLLAYLAIQMAGRDASPAMLQTFGEAVRDSLSISLFSGVNNINRIWALPGGNRFLLETADNGLFLTDAQNLGAKQLAVPGPVQRGVAYSNDGTLFLSWTDKTASLLDAGGQLISNLNGHTERICTGAVSPDNSLVATGGRDNTVRLWDTHTGRNIAVFSGHSGNIYSLAFSADGKLLLTRSSDGTACSWNLEGQKQGSFAAGSIYVRDAAFIPGTNQIVTASEDGLARIWNPDAQLSDSIRCSGAPLKSVGPVGQDGKIVLLGTDGVSILFDPRKHISYPLSDKSAVTGFEINSENILSRQEDNSLRIWDASGSLLQSCSGHKHRVLAAHFSPDGQRVLSTDASGTVKLWDKGGNILFEWPLQTETPVPAIFSSDGKSILLVEKSRVLTIGPLPELVLNDLKSKLGPEDTAIRRLVKEFDLQFLGNKIGD